MYRLVGLSRVPKIIGLNPVDQTQDYEILVLAAFPLSMLYLWVRTNKNLNWVGIWLVKWSIWLCVFVLMKLRPWLNVVLINYTDMVKEGNNMDIISLMLPSNDCQWQLNRMNAIEMTCWHLLLTNMCLMVLNTFGGLILWQQ